MKKYILIGLSVIGIYYSSFSQIQFSELASLSSSGRNSGIGCAANGKGYMGLGQNDKGVNLDDFWEYDTTKNVWNQKASFPGGGRVLASAYTVKDKIYVCFGLDNSGIVRKDVWEYNPATDKWRQKGDFPSTARYASRGFVIGDSVLYIGTGSDGGNYLSDFWMYHPRTDTWVKKTNFGGGNRQASASFAIENIGYFGGGISNSTTPQKGFWKYDPKNDTWTEIASLPYPSFDFISFAIDTKGYIGFGGKSHPFVNTNSFFIYNVASNNWESLEALSYSEPCSGGNISIKKRRGATCFVLGQFAYFGTGYTDENRLNDCWSLTFKTDGVKELKNQGLKVYPNPANTQVKVQLNYLLKCQKTSVSVFNYIGQLLLQQPIIDGQTIDISHLSKGLYILRVTGDNNSFVTKFLKLD